MENSEEQILVFENVIKMSMDTLKITRRTAELRVKAIIKSGILRNFGEPDGLPFQIAIDAAMQIPQMGDKED